MLQNDADWAENCHQVVRLAVLLFSPLFWSAGEQWAKEDNSVFCFIGTYPSFNAQVHHGNPGKFSSITYIPFHTLNFVPFSSTETNCS